MNRLNKVTKSPLAIHMNYTKIAVFVLAFSFGFAAYAQSPIPGEPTGVSEWVFFNVDGKLEYKDTEDGDRITDFSYAGYMGGGVALPDLPVKKTVSPLPNGADNTQLIQDAINEVAALPVDENGFRGAVLLAPGEFLCLRTININASGIVLRGSVGANGELLSTIRMDGLSRYVAIRVAHGGGEPGGGGGQGQRPAGAGPAVRTTFVDDIHVPSGALSFRVKDATGFQVGDRIEIRRPVTAAWVEFVVMHNLIRDGQRQTWMPIGSTINVERRIAAIDGDKIAVDGALTDSYNPKYLSPPGTIVAKLTTPSQLINQAGIEYLRIVSPEMPYNHSDPRISRGELPMYEAVRINGEDCWMRHVKIDETMNSVAVNGRRITLQFVDITRRALHPGSSRPAEFAPNGSQILIDRCTVDADNIWFIAVGGRVSGPNVILNCTFVSSERHPSRAEGHQRWSTAFLFDNCVVTNNGRIDILNRGMSGSGHGWALAWCVIWNCRANILVQEPPGTRNWAIGNIGNRQTAGRMNEGNAEYRATLPGGRLPEGTIDSHGVHVAPKSLYLTQLLERLGPEALKNIGY